MYLVHIPASRAIVLAGSFQALAPVLCHWTSFCEVMQQMASTGGMYKEFIRCSGIPTEAGGLWLRTSRCKIDISNKAVEDLTTQLEIECQNPSAECSRSQEMVFDTYHIFDPYDDGQTGRCCKSTI